MAKGQSTRAGIREMLDRKAEQLLPKANQVPSLFDKGVIKISCIKCGKHKTMSNLQHWKKTFYRCKDGCETKEKAE